jgi:hypothetical protein
MSVSNIKLLALTELVTDEPVPLYRTRYKLTTPVPLGSGLFDGGGVDTQIDEFLTESTFNLAVQQACADNANSQTGGVEAFVAADVYGGRI